MSVVPEKQIEYIMNAFTINAIQDGKKINIPQRFFTKVHGTAIDQRWDNPHPTSGSICKNIVHFTQTPSQSFNNEIAYSGQLVEVTFVDKLDLFGWDGSDSQHPLPQAKGPRELWKFTVVPKFNLLIIENGRAVEKKISEYLNFFCIQQYNYGLPAEEKLDAIMIEAVPVESNPVGYFRSNPNIGSFEAVINAREFQKQTYGPFSKMLEGLQVEEERLILKVSISSERRGHNLPTILVTHLGDFLENIDEDDLNQARVSEYDDGKKLRPTKLLGALQHKKKFIADTSEEKDNTMNKYVNELIQKIGEDLRINAK